MTAAITLLAFAAADVAKAADELNQLDGSAGDGDLGFTVTAINECIADSAAANGPGADLAQFLRDSGLLVAKRAPSTFGTLIATGFLSAARAVPIGEEDGRSNLTILADALEAAYQGMQSRGRAEIGDKTLLDALAPAIASLSDSARASSTLSVGLAAAASAARAGAEATRAMQPRAGRARWLANRSDGLEDAGAHAIALALTSAAAHFS